MSHVPNPSRTDSPSSPDAWEAIGPQLRARARQLLTDLTMISYSPGRSVVDITVSRSAERGAFGKPDSLYEKFIGPISHAFHNNDGEKLASICVEVETEIDLWRGQHKPEHNLPSDDQAAMKKVCEIYVGVTPLEVARRLHVDPSWVAKARVTHRRHADSGQKLDGWAGFSDEERLSHIHHAIDQGWSLRRAADSAGASVTTLHKHYGHYWRDSAA